MDFDLPADDDPRRARGAGLARRAPATHRPPAGRGRATSPRTGPARGASTPTRSTSSSSTTSCAGPACGGPLNPIGIGWAGPTLVHAGTEAQKERYLLAAARRRGDLVPAVQRARRRARDLAGARHPGRARRRRVGRQRPEDLDVAAPTSPARASSSPAPTPTRRSTRASRTSSARWTRPASRSGPIVEMTGDARLQRGVLHRRAHPGREPRRRGERRLGAGQGDARQRAGVAVGRRRAVGHGPDRPATCSTSSAAAAAAPTRCCASGSPQLYIESEILRLIRLRTVTARIRGEQPGPEASVRKVLADEHGQHIMGLAKDLAGRRRHCSPTAARCGDRRRRRGTTASCSRRRSPSAAAPARCSATSSAERVLGLPHDIDVEQGKTWAEARRLAGVGGP